MSILRANGLADGLAMGESATTSVNRWTFRQLRLGWLGALAIFGFIVCLTPGRFVTTAVLWLPLSIYAVSVFSVGDRLPQYTEPVEWAVLVVTVIGLDFCAASLYSLRGHVGNRAKSESGAAPHPPA